MSKLGYGKGAPNSVSANEYLTTKQAVSEVLKEAAGEIEEK